jgi:TolA-binding protein
MRPEQAAELLRDLGGEDLSEQRARRVQARVLGELRRRRDGVSLNAERSLSLRLVGAVAAVALLAALLLWIGPWRASNGNELVTLTDGSSVRALSSGARVVPELVSHERVVLRQAAGSAAYEVTPRPERTFVVQVDGARIEVLGTAFRVERASQSIRVSVKRGLVRVTYGESSASLTAGEEVTLVTSPAPASNAVRSEVAPPEPPAPVAEAPTQAAVEAAVQPADSAAPPRVPARPEPDAKELFRRADRARSNGDTVAALAHLQELVRLHPSDGRAPMAYFTIGRLEASRGNFTAAALAFEACGSGLNGEAIAEAALARRAAGQHAAARALAERYLESRPNGPRAPALTPLAR